MKETAYVYAVARIRANEMSLLSTADIEQMVAADNAKGVLQFLEDKGWIETENPVDIDTVFKRQAEKAWQLLCEIAPDKSELEFLIVRNDFHNIKSALKTYVANKKGADAFLVPSLIDPERIREAIDNKKLEDLPDFARDAAKKTYEILIRTMDGQLADILLDAMALNCMMAKADKTGSLFAKELAELFCVAANVKIALRAAQTGKDEAFLEIALCETKTLEKSALKETAKRGVEELTQYLSHTMYREAVEHIKTSTTAFEKWCDDIVITYAIKAKYISFGIAPLIAYFIAKDTEIKTVRMILSCKHNAIPTEIIRERVRQLYA